MLCVCFGGTAVELLPGPVHSDMTLSGVLMQISELHQSLSLSHLSSITREKLCTCRRDGLNNSKNIALLDLSHALEVLYHDMKVHYTALDRLSGWILLQKYHNQLLRRGETSVVTAELLQVSCTTMV